jgi:hypothetical protein
MTFKKRAFASSFVEQGESLEKNWVAASNAVNLTDFLSILRQAQHEYLDMLRSVGELAEPRYKLRTRSDTLSLSKYG